MKSIVIAVCLGCAVLGAVAKEDKAPAKTAAVELGDFSGKVAETMNAASYTYVLVDTGSKKLWAAAPRFDVKVGDTVKIGSPMPMQKYQSKTLNRTFDLVYFTGTVTVNGAPASSSSAAPSQGSQATLPAGHPPIGNANQSSALPEGHPPIGAATQSSGTIKGIKKAEGGSTVAEVYANQAKLNGKKTTVRGKVVKFNSMIMDRNWIHIQDGTGKPGSNDLLVTSKTPAKVGDTVLATGTIITNKDFGSGYKYDVLMENAEVVKE
jgi:hypothetical protein